MHIIISYESGEPIYEQIKSQLRGQILRGSIAKGSMLPSIRALAKELQIGIITAKRAYDDLCAEGFLYSVQGKGLFVSKINKQKADSFAVNEIRAKIKEVAAFAELNSVDVKIIKEIINEKLGE